ncbi:MAG: TetR/AcrR family transcriptional regulator [Streptosporangiaceae bacterium]
MSELESFLMPKIVDWESRRDEVLAATWRVIATHGLAGTTIRKIAKEAGYSPGVLAHYFSDKQDILGSALVLAHRRVGERMDRKAEGHTGLAALRLVMIEALPLDRQRMLEAQIEVSFWGRALGTPELARLQNTEFERLWGRLRRLLADAASHGEVRADLDIEAATHRLVALIDGLSVEAVLYPARVPADRQLALLNELVDSFSAAPAAAPSAAIGS